jgi:hypothetical protein
LISSLFLGELSLCCVNCIFVLLKLLRLFRSLLQFWVFSVKVKCQDLLGLVGLVRDRVGGLKAIDSTYSLGLIVDVHLCQLMFISMKLKLKVVRTNVGWFSLFFFRITCFDFLCFYVRIRSILDFLKN